MTLVQHGLCPGSVTGLLAALYGAAAAVPSLLAQECMPRYVDAMGGPGGNTVLAANGDPDSWVAPAGSDSDGLWRLSTAGRDGTVFEASGASGTEDAPTLLTEVSGLVPGAPYRVWVHYWSAPSADWAIRAGFAPSGMVLCNRLGIGGATPGATTVINLNLGTPAGLGDDLGGPAYLASSGTNAIRGTHDFWNGVAAADLPCSQVLGADGWVVPGVSVNVGRENELASGEIQWNLHDLLARLGKAPEGIQSTSLVPHSYLRENTTGQGPRALGVAIENLQAGQYQVYVVADNTYDSATGPHGNRAFLIHVGVGETSVGRTAFSGFPSQLITNSDWSRWKLGASYASFTVRVPSDGRDIVVTSEESTGLARHSLLNAVQVVFLGDGRCVPLRGYLGEGTADVDGCLRVFVDDRPAGSSAERTWYDGISLERVPPRQAQPFIVLNDNGAWCWFQDERAVIHEGKLVLGSIPDQIGTDGATRWGNVEVTTWDLATGERHLSVLHTNLEDDDHAAPAILVRPDGRFLVVYARHYDSSDHLIRWRISEDPGDSTRWQGERTLDMGEHVSYSHVYWLGATAGRSATYDFYRGSDSDQHYIVSEDDGVSWKPGGRLLDSPGSGYTKYAGGHDGSLHFVTVEAHPRYFPDSLYHGYLRDGRLFASDGSLLADLSTSATGGVKTAELTRVFPGDPENVAWPIDVHVDEWGRPYTVYSVRKSAADHRYRRAHWDGLGWSDFEIAYGGTRLYSSEDDYTGLAAIDPHDPDRVFISTNADPVTGEPLISRGDTRRHWEIFAGTTGDGGRTWSWTPITHDSIADNIRPVVPLGDSPATVLLWLRGSYRSYRSYDTNVVAAVLTSKLAKVGRFLRSR
jgi:hypothetical protein